MTRVDMVVSVEHELQQVCHVSKIGYERVDMVVSVEHELQQGVILPV